MDNPTQESTLSQVEAELLALEAGLNSSSELVQEGEDISQAVEAEVVNSEPDPTGNPFSTSRILQALDRCSDGDADLVSSQL